MDKNSEKTVGLVLEGGGHRGIYTAGVLDVFAENNISFDGIMGVSAGAIHAASYLSGQPGRSVRYTSRYCSDPAYMGLRSLFTTGNYFNVKFCYYRLPDELDPFDNDTFDANPVPFYTVATDIRTGKADYHLCDSLRGKKIRWLQASSSMPLAAAVVNIDNRFYLDGGIADSIPIKKMQEMGYGKNVVILTQEKGYRKKPNSMLSIIRLVYKAFPDFVKAVENRHNVYNSQLDYLEEEDRKGNVIIIRPSEKPEAGRTERNRGKILRTYELGRRDAENILGKIKSFLS